MRDGGPWHIEPERLVEMIIKEFGPLADSEEEKLIFEIDACLIGGVTILVNMEADFVWPLS